MTEDKQRLVVVGSGMSGLSAARAAAGQGEAVLLVNGEDRLPYKRTKISKNLAQPFEKDAFALASRDELRHAGIELLDGVVEDLDPASRQLRVGGETVSWRALVLATGAQSLHLFPRSSLVIRQAHDGDRLNEAARVARSAAVIGGGVLGVEVADQLRRRGLDVTIFSRDPQLMLRELTAEPAAWLAGVVTAHGIQYELNATVSDVKAVDDGYAVCADTRCLQVDLVVECAGSLPDVSLASSAGLLVERGVVVDRNLSTSVPGVFAAGDCVQLPDGTVPHLWHQAEDQGVAAGLNAVAHVRGTPCEAYANRPRRLKCGAFDEFIFSISAHLRDQVDDVAVYRRKGVHQEFGFRGGKLAMVIMTGDKEQAKAYEKAVWAGLTKTEAVEQFVTCGEC